MGADFDNVGQALPKRHLYEKDIEQSSDLRKERMVSVDYGCRDHPGDSAIWVALIRVFCLTSFNNLLFRTF